MTVAVDVNDGVSIPDYTTFPPQGKKSRNTVVEHVAVLVTEIGRRERIRTSDPFLPKEVRYQAALHAE